MGWFKRIIDACNKLTNRQFLVLAIPITAIAFIFYLSIPLISNRFAVYGTSLLEVIKLLAYGFFAIRLYSNAKTTGLLGFKLFFIASVAWIPGQVIQVISPIESNTPYLYSNSADFFLIIAVIFAVLGVVSLGLYGLDRREKTQIIVHAITFGSCVSFVGTMFVSNVWLQGQEDLIQSHLGDFISLSLDIIALSVGLSIALYRKKDSVAFLICLGLFFQAGADIMYLSSLFQGIESTRPVQRMFIWTALVLWVSAGTLKELVPKHKGSVRSEMTVAIGSYIAVSLVIAFGIFQATSISGAPAVVLYSFLLTFVAILVSQIIGFFDSKKLLATQQASIFTISKSEEKYQELATHDTLTNLVNRNFFIEEIKTQLNKVEIIDKQFTIMFVDLDRFKEVNDTYGHQAGDSVIKTIAGRIEMVVDEIGTVCRLGGDEFAIFSRIDGDTQSAKELAQRVLIACTEPIIVQGTENYISCSIGIAYNSSKENDSQSLLRNADAAMYRAKELGRNRIEESQPNVALKSAENAWTLNELHRAIADNQIQVFFQPVIEMASQRLKGFEALARWDHPIIGMVSPESFVAIAEDNGLIIELGNQIIDKSLRQLSIWQDNGSDNPRDLSMNINLSFRQLSDNNLIEYINRKCEFYKVSPSSVVFEMTESALLGDIKNAISVLSEIQSFGFHLQIDDFGTGYSSLSYLKKFPVSGFKIDRSYVQGYGQDEDDKAIVDALVGLGKSMDLVVTAEGVDCQATHEALVEMGCDLAQGYLYSKALPADEILLSNFGTPGKLKESRKTA